MINLNVREINTYWVNIKALLIIVIGMSAQAIKQNLFFSKSSQKNA